MSPPLVSVGLPTHNGERFLVETIESLLAQDYPNTEIVASDNASDDGSVRILERYAASTPRMRVRFNRRNLGAAANFNLVLAASTGTYFAWAGDHDLWHPAFLSRCVDVLSRHPHAVLAYPRTMLIDERGAELGLMDDQIPLESASAVERYRRLVWRLAICNMFYGVGVRSAVTATGGLLPILGADHVVLARLALMGPIRRVGDTLFFRRQNRPPEDPEENRARALADLTGSQVSRTSSIGALHEPMRNEHLRAVASSNLRIHERTPVAVDTLRAFRARFEVPVNQAGLRGAARAVIGAGERLNPSASLPTR